MLGFGKNPVGFWREVAGSPATTQIPTIPIPFSRYGHLVPIGQFCTRAGNMNINTARALQIKVARLAVPSIFQVNLAGTIPDLSLQGASPAHFTKPRASRAQGATEYLVILAVVLIVALIGVALLGFVPSVTSDAKTLQSDEYWRGLARPFGILERTVLANGTVSIVVQNKDAMGSYTLTGLNVSSGAYTTSTSFSPGETKTLVFNGAPAGTANAYYDFQVNISYTSPYGVAGMQRGTKNILGKYS